MLKFLHCWGEHVAKFNVVLTSSCQVTCLFCGRRVGNIVVPLLAVVNLKSCRLLHN